ncbi:unnamed protein product [Vicia faba]|uniref:RRM domain-containing protein n=1 Tax=Vicia faba TaxID=3906 RepID=A0AAV1A6D4_VICFA|nr:unnamed protein product [Vicia faba]
MNGGISHQRGGGGERLLTALKKITSIYFLEFSDDSKAKDFYDLFGCTGKVVEVAISPRRNNIGKKFDFTRFKEAEDTRLLAVRQDNVQIVGRKFMLIYQGLKETISERGKAKAVQGVKSGLVYSSKEENKSRLQIAYVGQVFYPGIHSCAKEKSFGPLTSASGNSKTQITSSASSDSEEDWSCDQFDGLAGSVNVDAEDNIGEFSVRRGDGRFGNWE